MTDKSSPTVLVVDDDPALARMLRVLLESDECLVHVAHDGKMALAMLESELRPDVVLLDLQMPVIDGRAFYREFRSRGYEAPVMLLSAYNAERTRFELGADDAMEKPCDPDALLARIRILASLAKSRESASV